MSIFFIRSKAFVFAFLIYIFLILSLSDTHYLKSWLKCVIKTNSRSQSYERNLALKKTKLVINYMLAQFWVFMIYCWSKLINHYKTILKVEFFLRIEFRRRGLPKVQSLKRDFLEETLSSEDVSFSYQSFN